MCRFNFASITLLLHHPTSFHHSSSPLAMPADDYTAAVSGGLKLKNVISSPKVSKSHKKKRPKSSQPESSISANAEISKDGDKNDGGDATIDRDDGTIEKSGQLLENGEAKSPPRAGKTEAELRHEERRRKRVCYFHTLASQISTRGSWLNNVALARRAAQARRHQDAQRACGRTEPLPQQFE